MQKVRLIISTLFALSMFTALPAAANEEETFADAAPTPVSEVGRYRFFDGQFAVTTLKGPDIAERHLFRIDSVTGTVWIGKQIQYIDKKSGRVVQQRYWELFEQYIEGPATVPVK